MENYYLVTAIFDIKRYYPDDIRWRSANKYIELFTYFNDLGLPTILFTEEHLKDKIKGFNNLHIIIKGLHDLPTYKLLKDKDNLKPVANGQHLNKEFTSVINSKFILIREAKEYLIKNNLINCITHLIWLDSGIGHIETIPPEVFKEDIKLHTHDKIMNVSMKAVVRAEVENISNYLQISHGKIAAGLFVVPLFLVEWYSDELWKYYKLAIEELNLMCYEEQLMSIAAGRYPEKFDFIFSDYFFLKNLRYITNDLPTVLNNLTFCREHGLTDIAMKIINLVFISIGKSRLQITKEKCCQFLYDAQISSFYKDGSVSKMCGLLLGYMYHNSNHGRIWITDRLANIRQNISYIGLDIDNAELFEEGNILSKVDVHKLLWKVMFHT